jgi:hypothetical protein
MVDEPAGLIAQTPQPPLPEHLKASLMEESYQEERRP